MNEASDLRRQYYDIVDQEVWFTGDNRNPCYLLSDVTL